MAETKGKSNKKFMILSAIGIFMVVDHHTFTAVNLLGDYIPYNSFFMPMFVFISGYFNKVGPETNLGKYTLKKLRSLLLPYLIISVLVMGFQWLINLIKMGEIVPWPSGYLLYMLERVITSGSPYGMVIPMWFVITLFATLMVYAIAKKLFGRIWNSYVMFGIFVILHLVAVYLAKNTTPEALHWFLIPVKVMFFLPFLELGILYREKFEKKHSEMVAGGKLAILFGLLMFNVIRTLYLPNAYDVAFDGLDELAGFTSPFIVTPLISSFVGILFWLTVVELIGKPFYESRFVNYLSSNTFWVMGMHILFYNVLNCILLLITRYIVYLPYFGIEGFQNSEFYFWEIHPNIKLAYVAVGLLGPLGVKWIYDRVLELIGNKVLKKEK